ncbi:Acyl-coenzyme A oxidase [Aphelenchoides besseyi]|nr:Acyl-coenzyme A oxidase [Aphelenchoides besseyi]
MVMLLQLARYLVKRAKEIRAGVRPSNVSDIAAYLFETPSSYSQFTGKSGRSNQWRQLQATFEHIARRLTLKAFDRLEHFKAAGDHHKQAWNNAGIDLMKVAAKAHTRTFLTRTFLEATFNEPKPEVEEAMGDLLHVLMHYELQDCRADAMEDRFMTSLQIRHSASELKRALEMLRKNAVNISDSFDLPDRYLCSVLGRRDGHVYENLYEWAKKSPLNKTEVLPFHHQILGKMMEEAKEMSKM